MQALDGVNRKYDEIQNINAWNVNVSDHTIRKTKAPAIQTETLNYKRKSKRKSLLACSQG